MIVGTRDIDRAGLRRACLSSHDLIVFAERMVPRYLRHVDAVMNNQKYLTAIIVRELRGIPYLIKSKLIDDLLDGVVVRGSLSTIVDIEDLFSNVDMDKVFKELFKEELKGV